MAMHEAMYYEKLDQGRVRCRLCPHRCTIGPDQAGICRQRVNEDGTLVSRIYGRVTSVAMDPIEKKPLYHFHPGRQVLSIGTNGCNLSCRHCQNWNISQEDGHTQEVPPEAAVRMAVEHQSFAIAYTYNEPLIWYEYVLDTARLAHREGLKNVLVSNGFVEPEPLAELLPFIDAMNLDIKAIRDPFYRKVCGAWLAPVLETAKAARRATHLEITNLVIPTHNDSDAELTELADWIAGELGPDTPTHLSAYFPRYRLKAPPTSGELLQHAYDIFSERLQHVYLGNVVMREGTDTVCPGCGALLIRRQGYHIESLGLDGNRCTACGAEINLVV
jgi:pyruvate formate lyase activating enzyme